jgi:tetratricopeptide (TPR) repeat protein
MQTTTPDSPTTKIAGKSQRIGIRQAVGRATRLYEQGQPKQAEALCQQIQQQAPDRPRVLHLLGLMAYERGELERAEMLIRQALQRSRHRPDFHNTLGMIYMAQGRPEEALACYQTCLGRINPASGERTKLLGNIANALVTLGRNREAIAYHRQALAIDPDDPSASWNLAHIYLSLGRFKAGWPGYESRFRMHSGPNMLPPKTYPTPRWDGSPFSGKTVLVHDEQGLGDILNFVRYLPMVKARGGTVLFETRKSMASLLQGFPGIDALIIRKSAAARATPHDYHVALLSLPGIFNTTPGSIPAQVPYFFADPVKVAAWRRRIDGDGLKVGVVWAGNLNNIPLRHRASRLERLRPFLKVPGVQLYGLQKGVSEPDMLALPEAWRFPNFGPDFEDFTDTAAAIECLDLVITIDTAVAHLAGALGKPTWIMLSHPPDWRWLLGRDDSPWYPTARLFRQRHAHDWDFVYGSVNQALRKLAASREDQ